MYNFVNAYQNIGHDQINMFHTPRGWPFGHWCLGHSEVSGSVHVIPMSKLTFSISFVIFVDCAFDLCFCLVTWFYKLFVLFFNMVSFDLYSSESMTNNPAHTQKATAYLFMLLYEAINACKYKDYFQQSLDNHYIRTTH